MYEFQLHLRRKDIPAEELLVDLRRVARKLGVERLKRDVYNQHGRFCAVTVRRRFGGWNRALEAAGLKINRNARPSNAELLDNLGAVWRKLGRQPVMDDMHRALGHSRYDPSAYPRRFGSWNEALLHFAARARRLKRSRRPAAASRARVPLPVPRRLGARGGDKNRAIAPPRAPRRSRRTPSWRLRVRVLLRDHVTCQMCGASPAKDPRVTLHVDHIVPWSKGGETVEANLRTLCEACNIGRGNQTAEEAAHRSSDADGTVFQATDPPG